MVSSRPRQQRPGTSEKRREILRAASDVFGSKGYANGTLADVAVLVDMTHAGILHHFGSKEHLLLEVLRYRDTADVEVLADGRLPDGLELFRHFVRTATSNERRPGVVRASTVLSGESVTDDHPAHGYFTERYAQLRGLVADAFRVACAEQGVSDGPVISHASASILGVMDGLQLQWLLAPSDIDLARTSAFAIDAIVAAVLSPVDSPL